ncbi:MAG: hypothetical protein U0031_06990 [Thermomicrobiales bacterium]
MAPVTADWYEALEGCSGPCADTSSPACRTCITDVLETFADPLAHCLLHTSMGSAARRDRERADHDVAAAGIRTCDIFERRLCRINAIVSDSGQAAYGTLVGALDGPIGALGGFLANFGQLYIDLRDCEQQYGCPEGECDPVHQVCCDSGNCKYYDPNTKSCSITCGQDHYCDGVSQTCKLRCKQCGDYLVDGRQMPCGQITNNCGQVLTCNGCPQGKQCVNRRCVPCASRKAGNGRQGRDGDACCLPQTCEDLGAACGSHDDGCGGTVHCGGCPEGQTCNAQGTCECERRTCAWYYDHLTSECFAETTLPDGCGGSIICGKPCASGHTCLGGGCCPENRTCGQSFINTVCCPEPGLCCLDRVSFTPSGLLYFCCPSGKVCQGSVYGLCQERS